MSQITQPSDLLPLGEIIKDMMADKYCWQALLTDDNQLRLYLGTGVSSSIEPELNEQQEWIFRGQTNSWKLESVNQATSYSDEDELGFIEFGHQIITTSQENAASINEKLRVLERTYLIFFGFPYTTFDLSITFDPQPKLNFDPQPELAFSLKYRLTLMPDLEADLPYWEFITPNQMLLKFGPGKAWYHTVLQP
ncbi:hypothetical protein AB0758_00160 [Tolypothrix bouteillei VB521301_2]|uniref:Uncharacterized protein n=1 Tax=Tolypothrix bouteillei VB521301 TaxID=1479485 RepID=A0A0C1NMD7_9CYAN